MLYLKSFRNNIDMVRWFYEKYYDEINKHTFEFSEFHEFVRSGASSKIQLIDFLISKHPHFTEDFVKSFVDLLCFNRNLKAMTDYFDTDTYGNLLCLDFCALDIYYLMFNISLHENDEIYYDTTKYLHDADISINLRHWIYDELSNKIINCPIEKKQISQIFTDVLSKYSYDDYFCDNISDSNYTSLSKDHQVKENYNNISILKFCAKHNICVDYYTIFEQKVVRNDDCPYFLIDKVSINFVSNIVERWFDSIDIQTLRQIYKYFPNLVLQQMPTSELLWNYNNIDKIKLLLQFFSDEDYHSIFTGAMSIVNALYVLANTQMEQYMYEYIASRINQYRTYNIDDANIVTFINTLCKAHSNRRCILDIYLSSSVAYNSTYTLDKLCELGASIYDSQDHSELLYETLTNSNYDAVKWLYGHGINLKKYESDMLSVIAPFDPDEIFNFVRYLEELGFEKIAETLITSYVWRDYSNEHVDSDINKYIQNYDTTLINICKIYCMSAKQYLYDNDLDVTAFNSAAEVFDYSCEDFMFVKFVSFTSNIFIKRKFTFDDMTKLYAMIKQYYPRVIFSCINDQVDFTIKQIKSCQYITKEN
jgi:hypothetical protein